MSPIKNDVPILLILGAAHSLNHSLFLVIPPLLGNISEDLGASFQTLGFIVTVAFLIYGAGALVGGPLSDRFGGVRIAKVSIALGGASAFVFLASHELVSFAAGMFLMAFWASFYHPTSNNLISRLFVENTAGAMGVHGAAGSVGQIFTPTIAYLIGVLVDWRFAFAFFGLFSVLTALVMGRIGESEDSTKGLEKASLSEYLKVPNLGWIMLYNVFVGLSFRGVELFFPAFLSLSRGLSGQLAAVSNSLVLFFGVIGQFSGGRFADRYGPTKVILASSIGVVASMLLLLLTPVAFVGIILFIVLYGIAYFGQQPAMTSLVGSVTPSNFRGLSYGVMFFFTFGLGSASAGIAGYFADHFSLDAAYWAMSLFSFMSLAVSLILLRNSK